MREVQTVMVTGVGLGIPGAGRAVFDDDTFEAILRGDGLIDSVPGALQQAMLDKSIVRLVKSSASFERIEDLGGVIKLAGRLGDLDPVGDHGLDPKLLGSLDTVTRLAIACGLEALRDAGVPLVRRAIRTRSGKTISGVWGLPESLRDTTGVILGSAFPGLDSLIDEVTRQLQSTFVQRRRSETAALLDGLEGTARTEVQAWLAENIGEDPAAEGYTFARDFLFKILSMGHSQLAQLLGARGPNTQINGACASASQALGIAQDWIRVGRCDRVLVVTSDDASSENLLPWLGSGFLAAGAACTEARAEDGALPFSANRDGMIVGAGAAGFVLESEPAARARGVMPLSELMDTRFVNSAFHGSRLDVAHISRELCGFVQGLERDHGVSANDLVEDGMWCSHETYTPARGGSAEAELRALEAALGDRASDMLIINTKGFTGHAMAAGIEEAVAIRAMSVGRVPPIYNHDKIDPELGHFNFSRGGAHDVRYALRMGAGFGSQLALSALRRVAEPGVDRFTSPAYDAWLRELGGNRESLFREGRVLRMKTGEDAAQVAPPVQPVRVPVDTFYDWTSAEDVEQVGEGYNPWA